MQEYMENIIEIRNVEKSFYDEPLFNNISLDIKRGDIVGFIGENGCGKSVLFKMICGLISVDKGTITVSNTIITNGNFPKSVGIMLDGTGFIPYFSGYKNLKNIAVIDDKINDQDIYNSMALVGLDYKSKKPVKKYSLGMKQRLGLAMALMENPRLLLLDEPMNALDKEMVNKIREILLKLSREKKVTILITSHNEKDIEALCTHVYEIKNNVLQKKY